MGAGQQQDNDDYDDDGDPGDGDGGGEGARIRSLDQVFAAIERLEDKVNRAFSGGGGGRSRPEPASSGSRTTLAGSAEERRREIREELSALKAQEKADAERGDLMTRLGKVEKAVTEQPPRQLRKIEERMGWHRA